MATYRKKPVVIEAFNWTGAPDQTEDPIWAIEAIKAKTITFRHTSRTDAIGAGYLKYWMEIHTLEGVMRPYPGDWIIRGVKGEIYPCKSYIFAATYEPTEPSDAQ